MKTSLLADPNAQSCLDCAVRPRSICCALDDDEIHSFGRLGRHIQFASGKTVFGQEDITASFYDLLEGVMRLYKLLPDGRRQIVGFALPGDFLGMAAASHHVRILPATASIAIPTTNHSAAFAQISTGETV